MANNSIKYIDVPSTMQVIGNIYMNPEILELEDKYHFNSQDFPNEFHNILFGSIYNLYHSGAKKISSDTIEDYLANRPKKLAVFKANKGDEYLAKLAENTNSEAFEYYYSKVKKMTLLRMYDSIGMDLRWLYDINNIMELGKRQKQEEWLDNHTLEEIADCIDKKISNIRLKYVDDVNEDFSQAGDNIIELINKLETTPEIGYPLYGDMFNSIFRGARLKKFYLRSAATGVGKTRMMIADICYIACDEMWDEYKRTWVSCGVSQPALFIATEQDIEEIQTMMLSFISAVDEEVILTGSYTIEQKERVLKASQILARAPLYVKQLPDFSLQDIESTIKYSINTWDVKYIGFDYLHSSMKILSEVSGKASVKGLREDNVLFMMSVRLKDICNKYGVFIITSTQLNAEYTTAQQYDQNLLRGAKAIADKVDAGSIALQVSKMDIEALGPMLTANGLPEPQIKVSIYKNRRGKYKDILVWCTAKRGICRIEPIFATNYNYELINIPKIKIEVK